MKFIVTLIGTFGFTGFFPFAPATFASFVFVLIYAYVPGGRLLAHPIAVLVTLLISVPVSTSLERRYGHDASRIVIDEVVGMQVILMLANPSMWGIVLAFFLFRFFDIVKVFPADRSQRLPRGYGIVCDDFIAGIYSRVVLIILAAFFSGIGEFGLW
jgi:phosphatidylglycerophosphatase A